MFPRIGFQGGDNIDSSVFSQSLVGPKKDIGAHRQFAKKKHSIEGL